MGIPFLRDLVLVLATSLAAVLLLRRAKLPAIVGFLVAGIVIGPGGLELVHDAHTIEVLAEVGVVLLLFTIGLKLSLAELTRMRRLVFVGGGLQVVLTIGVAALVLPALGSTLQRALFVGFLVTMSSTAVVLRILEERAEAHAPHGRLATGILIFQDLAVVPFMLLLPVLGGQGGTLTGTLLTLGKSLGLLAAVVLAARVLFPRLLHLVARTRSREAFTLATVLGVIGTAWVSGQIGLSLALGAFLAGVVISESEYAQQVLSEFVPLRDVFNGLFFVSVGMLVRPADWAAAPMTTLGVLGALLVAKSAIVFLVARVLGFGSRVAVLAGLSLFQIGEFSFILALAGQRFGLLDEDSYRLFLGVSVLSMALTPFGMMLSPWLAARTLRAAGEPDEEGEAEHLDDHVIVIGYGVSGQNVVRVLEHLGVAYVVVELNPQTVRKLRGAGLSVLYGDAAREDVLVAAGIASARALVMAMGDAVTARQIVAAARRLGPEAEIVARTRFVSEMDELYQLGADDVVPEEFETSLELAARVMACYGATERQILREKAEMRRERYGLLRHGGGDRGRLSELLAESELSEVELPARAAGRTLRDLDLRAATGATVLGIDRRGKLTTNPPPDLRLEQGDMLLLFGTPDRIEAARKLFAELDFVSGGPEPSK